MTLDENEIFNVDKFEFDIAKGSVNGDLNYNLKTLEGLLNVNINNTDAQIIADDFFEMPGQIYGTVTGKLKAGCKGHNLPEVNILNDDATINVNGGKFEGMDRYACREAIVKELDEIAKAKGIDISLADPSSYRGSKVFKRARYSTLQDLDAKRHTEIDMFSGAIIRMGKQLGIPTPYNEFTFHMITALEEKNDGNFDYS